MASPAHDAGPEPAARLAASGTVVIACDKFKGSLRADQVARHLAIGLAGVAPEVPVARAPVADGGDGTLLSAIAAGFRRIPVRVEGPTGAPVDAAIGVSDGVAVVELATASGMDLLPGGRPDPLGSTSRGTGQLIRAALDQGCTEIVLGVGGSASTDGGAGMLEALGARLLDHGGAALPRGGAALARLGSLDVAGLDPRLARTGFVLASDVDNPLLGPRGGTRVYGPQKGAGEAELDVLETALAHWAGLVDPAAALLPGAGAAGGVGFAALAVLGARRRPGVEVVLELIGFGRRLGDAALVITGEGCLDEQTLFGKAPAGVAAAAGRAGVPVIAVCGQCRLPPARLARIGIRAAYPLTDVEPDVGRAIAAPAPLLERIGARIARDWLR